jgi:hypothetical protein
MKVITLVLNSSGEPHFRAEDEVDLENLFVMAKEREQKVLSMGASTTAGAIAFYGGEVLKAVDSGENDDVTQAIYSMLMATWLFDSLYGEISMATYKASNMEFTISHNGAVMHTRVPATAAG